MGGSRKTSCLFPPCAAQALGPPAHWSMEPPGRWSGFHRAWDLPGTTPFSTGSLSRRMQQTCGLWLWAVKVAASEGVLSEDFSVL